MNGAESFRVSFLIHLILAIALTILGVLGMNYFRSSPVAIVLAGFFGSMTFVLVVLFIGHIYVRVGIKQKPGLVAINVTFVTVSIFCLIIHPYSCLACLACSIPMMTYLIKASNLRIPEPPEARIKAD
jgi:hypothetical protein